MNLKSIAVTGKSKAAVGVTALKEALPNGLEMSDHLHSALAELAADKKVTTFPEKAEVESVRGLSVLMFSEKAGDMFTNDLELALLSPVKEEEPEPAK